MMKPFLLACAALGALPGLAMAQSAAGDSATAKTQTAPAKRPPLRKSPAAPVPATVARKIPPAPKADPARMLDARRTVQARWSRYDTDNKGSLDPLEFGTWVMTATSGQDGGKAAHRTHVSAAKMLNGTSAAFAKADTNHDRRITPAELTAFLGN